MATIKRAPVAAAGGDLVKIWKWTGLISGSLDGEPLGPEWLDYVDRCVQVVGSLDGATVVLQGSIDGATWVTLNAPGNNAISFTSTGLRQILESAPYIRPLMSGGTAPNVDVYVSGRRATRGTN